MPEGPQHRWQVIQLEEPLRWQVWDDQAVVYNPATGDTHLFDLLAGETLKSLEESPADLETLSRRVSERCHLPLDAALREQVARLLKDFDSLGLIEAVAR